MSASAGKPGPVVNYDSLESLAALDSSSDDSSSEEEALVESSLLASSSVDSSSDEELADFSSVASSSDEELMDSSADSSLLVDSSLSVDVEGAATFVVAVVSASLLVESSELDVLPLADIVICLVAVSEPAAAVIVTDPVKPSGGSKAAANVPFALDVTVPVPEPPVTLASSLTEVASAKSLPWTTTRPSIVESVSVGVPVAAFAAGIPIASTSTPAAAPAISRRDFPVVDPVIQVGRS